MKTMMALIPLILGITLIVTGAFENKNEPTRALESEYQQDIRQATTSSGLSKADLAWHAQNTYGWDCNEVVMVGKMSREGYYVIQCANDIRLRVYPRDGQHPRITNIRGTYE